MENFHIKNSNKDYVSTRSTYAKEFSDLGVTYDAVKELKRDEEASFIIVYKVDKNLDKDRFVMYYQEKNGYLRKIKIKIKDLSKIEKAKDLKVGDTFKIGTVADPDEVSFDEVEISKTVEYNVKSCNVGECSVQTKTVTAPDSYNILKITYGSESYSSNKMLKFIKQHGKITYVDKDKFKQEVEIESAIDKKYYGKELLLKIPSDITDDTKLILNLIIRNKEYNYKLN